MTDPDSKPTTELALFCPMCKELIEVADPRSVLLAAHLSSFCSGTADILHP